MLAGGVEAQVGIEVAVDDRRTEPQDGFCFGQPPAGADGGVGVAKGG